MYMSRVYDRKVILSTFSLSVCQMWRPFWKMKEYVATWVAVKLHRLGLRLIFWHDFKTNR